MIVITTEDDRLYAALLAQGIVSFAIGSREEWPNLSIGNRVILDPTVPEYETEAKARKLIARTVFGYPYEA